MEAEKIIDEQEGEGEERRALRLLLGGKLLRKRRMRRLLLAGLLRRKVRQRILQRMVVGRLLHGAPKAAVSSKAKNIPAQKGA